MECAAHRSWVIPNPVALFANGGEGSVFVPPKFSHWFCRGWTSVRLFFLMEQPLSWHHFTAWGHPADSPTSALSRCPPLPSRTFPPTVLARSFASPQTA